MKKLISLLPLTLLILLCTALAIGITSGTLTIKSLSKSKDIHKGHNLSSASQASTQTNNSTQKKAATKWTCSMHPQIILPSPGKCPICAMDLIPLETGPGDDLGPTTLVISQSAKKLAEIQVSQIQRKFVSTKIRMVGKIAYNERNIKTLSAWIPGRIENLFVDYTGINVLKNDHLAELYSPQLLTAQQELLSAKNALKNTNETNNFLLDSSKRTYQSTLEKLRLWGLTPEQIKQIEISGKTSDKMTIFAPQAGVVIQKYVSIGDYVKTGSKLYTIADLSRLWLLLDAYESDLSYLHYGQKVEITTSAYPGKTFHGKISFINPQLDEKTRTIKVRVNLDNSDLKLKPGMFVSTIAHAKLGQDGNLISATLAGKWISPMHPHIIKNKPGSCDICGMALVKADEYFKNKNKFETTKTEIYTCTMHKHVLLPKPGKCPICNMDLVKSINPTLQQPPIVVPATAVLKTGKRAVVYLEIKNQKLPTYRGTEINLGPRVGDYYIVNSGLNVDDWVVTNGNFKLDSALQIQAKPSMMNVVTKNKTTTENNTKSKLSPTTKQTAALKPLYTAYLNLQEQLAKDNLQAAIQALKPLSLAVNAINEDIFSGKSKEKMKDIKIQIIKEITKGTQASNFKDFIRAFEVISIQMIAINNHYGNTSETFYQASCPMAFNGRGASWLQRSSDIKNPFLPKTMSGCGSIDHTFKFKPINKNESSPQKQNNITFPSKTHNHKH